MVIAEVPQAHSIHMRHRHRVCDVCFVVTSSGLGHSDAFQCPNLCGTFYCSSSCKLSGVTRHTAATCSLLLQANHPSAAKASKAAHAHLSLCLSVHSSPLPVDRLLSMMQEPSKKGAKDAHAAEAKFRELGHSGAPLAAPGQIAAALRTKKLNAIGMFDAYGDEVGFALAPALAMVNHSCFPNCQQVTFGGACRLIALRGIEAGEELSYSYVSLDGSEGSERRELIQENWAFTCRCGRCTGGVEAGMLRAFDDEHVCCCGAVCLAVDRSTAECVCNISFATVPVVEAM
jgi:hypothetical protein